MTKEDWDAEVDEMCWAVEWYAEHAYDCGFEAWRKELPRALEGMKRAGKRLGNLWW